MVTVVQRNNSSAWSTSLDELFDVVNETRQIAPTQPAMPRLPPIAHLLASLPQSSPPAPASSSFSFAPPPYSSVTAFSQPQRQHQQQYQDGNATPPSLNWGSLHHNKTSKADPRQYSGSLVTPTASHPMKHGQPMPSGSSSFAQPTPSSSSHHTFQAPPSAFSIVDTSTASKPKHNCCPVCPKSFSRPSSLYTHMHSHTGERPYQCSESRCQKRFSVLSNLRRHMRIHQKNHDNGGHLTSSSSGSSPEPSTPCK